ncbi:MAG: hypothetical protein MUC36_28215 [Planctomycetes bacterium]|nr:hypothetical protein [Planctomycetota bacterium]
MTMPKHSTDQDNIARYVHGDMTVDEQIAFEVGMVGRGQQVNMTESPLSGDGDRLDRRQLPLACHL